MKTRTIRAAYLTAFSLGLSINANALITGQTLMAGWYQFDNNTTTDEASDQGYFAGAIGSAKVMKGGVASDNHPGMQPNGCSDGVYGVGDIAPFSEGFATNQVNDNNGHLTTRSGANSTIFWIKNTTGEPIQLATMLFDAANDQVSGTPLNSFLTLAWSMDSWATSNALDTAPATVVGGNGNTNEGKDYKDFRYNLVGTVRNSLDVVVPGAVAVPMLPVDGVIQFKFTSDSSTLLDNIAFSMNGIPIIPEPGSMLALGCFLSSGLLIRRNRRRVA